MRIKLEQTPLKVIEVEKPDGSVLTITMRRIIMADVGKLTEEQDDLNRKYQTNQIDAFQYWTGLLSTMTVDFKADYVRDLEIPHIMEISKAIREQIENKPEVEKKSP